MLKNMITCDCRFITTVYQIVLENLIVSQTVGQSFSLHNRNNNIAENNRVMFLFRGIDKVFVVPQ